MASATDLFTKTYADRAYRFPTMVRHAGTVVAFAMDADRRIRYSVLDPTTNDPGSMMDADHWSPDPAVLAFATEIAAVGFGVADQIALPPVRIGTRTPVQPGITVNADELDPLLSTTARLSAAAAFQVVSDGRYVYLLRQAVADPDPAVLDAARKTVADPAASAAAVAAAREIVADHDAMVYVTDPTTGQPVLDANGRVVPVVRGTLLVDRFVLTGTALHPKLDVRFQRSRSRTRPASSTDTLGATDLDKFPFVEPTQDLRFVTGLSNGAFAAALVPTGVADVFRWQVFTYDAHGDVVRSYSAARTKDGLFDTLGQQPLTCTDHPDVFSLAPGTCPRPALADPTQTCGKTLVARSDTTGGAGGTALSFPADTPAVVTLDGAVTTGAEFTLEAWLKTDPMGTGERALLGGDAAGPGDTPPSIWITDGTTLRIAFGDGQRLQQTTTAAILTPGAWNHVAVSFGDGVISVHLDGVLQHAAAVDKGSVPTASAITRIAGTASGFAGILDEVRIWSVSLTPTQIETQRHMRLIGTEGGLAGYWRLDEGSGFVTFDDSPAGAKGMLDGPTWVGSGAPICDPVGLTRSAIRLAGRRVSGGLGSSVYYQQENVSGGYTGQAKPLKQAARVMLALVSTRLTDAGPASVPTGPALVTALDFGVGSDGLLADLPVEVALTDLSVGGPTTTPGENLLAELVQAQADVATLSDAVTTLTAHVADLRQVLGAAAAIQAAVPNANTPLQAQPIPTAYSDIAALLARVATLRQRLYDLAHSQGAERSMIIAAEQAVQQILDSVNVDLTPRLAAVSADLASSTGTLVADTASLATATATEASLRSLLDHDTALYMPLLHLDGRGLSVSGAVLDFAPAQGSAPTLLDGALGRVTLYGRGANEEFLYAYYDTFTGRTRLTVPTRGDSDGILSFIARSTESEFDDVTVTITPGDGPTTCTATVSTVNAGVTETWNRLPRNAIALASILNGTAPDPVVVGTTAAPATTGADKTEALSLDGAGLRLPLTAGAMLDVGVTVLQVAEDTARGATSVPVVPSLVVVPSGATVRRIAYDPAAATSTRAGADLRSGSLLVAADSRAAVGQMLDGASTTQGASPACRWFAAAPGTALVFDGATSAGVLSRTALHFNGTSDGITLAQTAALNLRGDVTLEAWIRPAQLDGLRDVVVHGPSADRAHEVYLRIINGQYQIGTYDGADHFAGAAIPANETGGWVHLAGVYGGGRWQLYRNGLLFGSSMDATGATPVTGAWAIGCDADGRERFFSGDIDEVRIWSRALDPAEITDGMNRRLSGTEAALAGYWYAVDGVLTDQTPNKTAVAPAPVPTTTSPKVATSPTILAPLAGFDVVGDVCVETWVNPSSTEQVSQVLAKASPAGSYQLALHAAPSAARFAGGTGGIALPDDPSLRITGRVTVEAWIKMASSDGLRDIVAHGYYYGNPNGEVYLRVMNGAYQLGRWTNNNAVDASTQFAVPPGDVGTWVHLAGTWDGQAWRLYRNGVPVGSSNPDATGAPPVPAAWTVGGSLVQDRVFNGDIDEVRIWSVTRAGSDIVAAKDHRLTGTEAGLVGVWRVDGGMLRDGGPRHLDSAPGSVAVPAPGVMPYAYTAVVGVNDQVVETAQSIPAAQWSHVAAVFDQHYGLQFTGGGYLDAGDSDGLNLTKDLTIEIGARLDTTGIRHGLISRGTLQDGTADDVPYALSVLPDGRLELAFEDVNHALHRISSTAPAVGDTAFHRLAVTRQHRVKVDTTNTKPPAGTAVVDTWDEVVFYVDGTAVGAPVAYRGPQVGSSQGSTLIGRVLNGGAAATTLTGTLSEVRLWNSAREATTIGAPVQSNAVGLVARWTFQEGIGNMTAAVRGGSDAVLHGGVAWVHTPDGQGSSLVVHLDGRPVATTPVPPANLPALAPQVTVGALDNDAKTRRFIGQLAEMRIWRTARTTQEVQDNLFGRLTGDASDLVADYRFDAAPGVQDHGPRGNGLPVSTGARYVVSTAPIAEDSPVARNAVLGLASRFQQNVSSSPCAVEYAELEAGSSAMGAAATRGALKRAYAMVDSAGAWHLVTGFKVGDLMTEWVGQAQFDPQLIGYIEGAPPVPSENLTVTGDYTGATSVALADATSTNYTFGTTRDSGFNATFELSAGEGEQVQTFAGLMEIEAPLGIGVGEVELTNAVSGGVTFTGKATFETSLSWLDDTTTGQGSTRTRVSSLSLTGHPESQPAYPAVGTRFVPNNVGFALVQSQTADVYALRLRHTGTLVAYQMRPNPDIPKDWNIITFPIDPRYTKQGVLDGHVGGQADSDYPNALTYSPDLSYFKPIEAYQLKNGIDREEEQLSTLFAQHSVDPNQLSGGQLPPTVLPVKRNLVNTYVWTADGGQFAETTQLLDTYSENVSGAYHFQGLAGGTVSADVDIFGVSVNFELSAMFGGHLDLSVTKQMDSQRSFEVDVTTGGEQDITTVKADGTRVKQPGKVDAYRWMTFYLEPEAANHDLFFNRVVDPIWLAESSDPAAAALRQAQQDAKSPAAWRVMHRVTYVSRVLEDVGAADQAPVDKAIASLDLTSNYELVRTLEPYVRGRTGSYPDFAQAVRSAVAAHLPDLLPHIGDVLTFLVLYFGVADAPQLNA